MARTSIPDAAQRGDARQRAASRLGVVCNIVLGSIVSSTPTLRRSSADDIHRGLRAREDGSLAPTRSGPQRKSRRRRATVRRKPLTSWALEKSSQATALLREGCELVVPPSQETGEVCSLCALHSRPGQPSGSRA